MANAQQVENVIQQTLEHSLISVEFGRRVHVWTLVDLDEMELKVSIENEVKPVKFKERELERMLLRLEK